MSTLKKINREDLVEYLNTTPKENTENWALMRVPNGISYLRWP